jgi:hypothetical protein
MPRPDLWEPVCRVHIRLLTTSFPPANDTDITFLLVEFKSTKAGVGPSILLIAVISSFERGLSFASGPQMFANSWAKGREEHRTVFP